MWTLWHCCHTDWPLSMIRKVMGWWVRRVSIDFHGDQMPSSPSLSLSCMWFNICTVQMHNTAKHIHSKCLPHSRGLHSSIQIQRILTLMAPIGKEHWLCFCIECLRSLSSCNTLKRGFYLCAAPFGSDKSSIHYHVPQEPLFISL